MSIRKIIVGILIIAATSILLVGLLTGFRYDNLDIQLHDTYYVIDPVTLAIVLTLTFTLTSSLVSSIAILKRQQLLFRLILIAGMSVLLVVPVMILYMRLLMLMFSK